MTGGLGSGVFELFALENDTDIDFETAYKMISKFDEDISLFNDGSDLPKLDATEHKSLENLEFPTSARDMNEVGKDDQVKIEELPTWEDPLMTKEGAEHAAGQSEHVRDSQALAKAELLSRYESSAIEHFLDSLISQNDGLTAQDAPNQLHNETINMAELQMMKEDKWEVQEEKSKVKTEISAHDETSLEVYNPPVVEIPEFSVDDSEAPKEILDNPTRLRKWKHVETERLRRTNIKKVFDDLIGMTRYPRISDPAITKPRTEKRVPKHTLLNFILEDLQLIHRANEELEMMLKECGDIKG